MSAGVNIESSASAPSWARAVHAISNAGVGIEANVPHDGLVPLGDLDVEKGQASRTEELATDERVAADVVRIDPRTGLLHGTFPHQGVGLVVVGDRPESVAASALDLGVASFTHDMEVLTDALHRTLSAGGSGSPSI